MTQDQPIIVEVKSRHGQVSDRMEEHAIKKVARLGRYNDRVVRIEIVADHPHESPEVEIIAHMRRGAPLVAKDRGVTFSSTVDQIVEKMEKQLKKLKEKQKDHKGATGHRDGTTGTPGATTGTDDDDETYEDVVRRDLKE